MVNRSVASTGHLVPWAMAAISATVFVVASWLTADIMPLRPDTASYLYFDPSRPIGYPFFLWVVNLFGSPALAVTVQKLLLTVSLFLLGLSFYRWSGRPILSILFQLAVLLSPEMWKFSGDLNTEALATAGVALWCAQLIRTLQTPSTRAIGLLSIIAGLAMLVKPSLVMLFIGTAVAAFLLQTSRERRNGLILASAALLISLAVNPIANLFLHGSAATASPVARGVLQHSLFCTPSQLPTDPDNAFVEHYSKAVRDYIASAPPSTHDSFERIYTGKLRFGLIIPALGRRHGMQASWQTDPLIWKIAKDRIVANPGCYARSVISSYFNLATYKSYSSAESRRLSEWMAARPPVEIPLVRALPRDEQLAKRAAQELGSPEPRLPGRKTFEGPTGRPLALIWLARFIYGSAAIAGLVAIFMFLAGTKLKPELRKLTICAAALGVVFHGVIGLTAIVELFLTRYTVPLGPVVCTLLAIIAVAVLNRLSLVPGFWIRVPQAAPSSRSANP